MRYRVGMFSGFHVRSRLLVVVWLLLAMLPLRGLAHELMAVAAPANAGASAMVAADDHASPCHGATTMTAADTSVPTGHAGGCTLCDLCHAALALPSAGVMAADAPHGQALPEALPAPHGRPEPEPLFRPPRA